MIIKTKPKTSCKKIMIDSTALMSSLSKIWPSVCARASIPCTLRILVLCNHNLNRSIPCTRRILVLCNHNLSKSIPCTRRILVLCNHNLSKSIPCTRRILVLCNHNLNNSDKMSNNLFFILVFMELCVWYTD
jgi:hypothetical protein